MTCYRVSERQGHLTDKAAEKTERIDAELNPRPQKRHTIKVNQGVSQHLGY